MWAVVEMWDHDPPGIRLCRTEAMARWQYRAILAAARADRLHVEDRGANTAWVYTTSGPSGPSTRLRRVYCVPPGDTLLET
jgi:hypothetical protein